MNPLALLRSYRYELVAFFTGAAVMVLEIVGARLIAPQFGASTYVWTAMIGVILGSLAIGFAVGGKLADKYHSPVFLRRVLFAAAMLVLGMGLLQHSVLASIAGWQLDLRLSALLAAIVLFGPPSLLIGMVSPHLAKVRITSLDETGRTIGKLEAAGALGSIAGTFSCGYYLLGQFGSRSIIIGVVLLLIATSLIVDPYFWRKRNIVGLALALLMTLTISANPSGVLADVDSAYARYQVLGGTYGPTPARLLVTDQAGIQSATPADGSGRLLFGYTQRFQAAAVAYGNPDKVLVVGGGTHTFPAYLVRHNPTIKVDVVEIDPMLEKLAKQYFFLKDSPRLTIYHEDGRAYLNRNAKEYDMVFMDAFSSLSPPFQLTTLETVQRIRANLAPGGVVAVNVIGAHQNGQGEYLRAVKETYQRVFTQVIMTQVHAQLPLGDTRQNMLLIASDDAAKVATLAHSAGPRLTFAPGPALVLTDDYAPIERLTF